MTFEDILKSLKKKEYAPVYFLMGEESFFIDQITDYIIENALNESDKDFNQTILYGKDTRYWYHSNHCPKVSNDG